MTEVPEHLLRRSKERRSALGLEGGGGDAGAPPAGQAEAAATPPPAAGAATPATPEPAAAAPPAVVEPPRAAPPYITAAVTRPKVPRWAVPVLAALPVWALIYAGSMTAGEAGLTDPVLVEGEEIYSAQCSACHGPGGEGGTGRPLNAGEVVLTFPDPQQHIAWVVEGSPAPGTPYGDPARPGGQRISQSDGFGAMPAFGGTLTEEEILAVVRYEREVIGGETSSALAAAGELGTGAEGGEGAAEGEGDGEELGGAGGEGTGTTVPGESSPPSTTAGATGGNTGGTEGSGTPDVTTPQTPSTTVAGNQ